MLGKLAYRNTKRNIKDYLIYLITVTASFSLIFAFNLVANSDEIVKLCSSEYYGAAEPPVRCGEVLPQLSVIIVISHVPQLCFKQLPATSSIHCTFYHF